MTSGSRSCHERVRSASSSAVRGYRTTSASSARNIVRAWLSRATRVESISGECCRIRDDW